MGKYVESWREEQIDDDHGRHHGDARDPGEANPIRLSRKTEEGVAAVLRGVEGGQQYEEPETAASKIKVTERVLLSTAIAQPTQHDENDQIEADDGQLWSLC